MEPVLLMFGNSWLKNKTIKDWRKPALWSALKHHSLIPGKIHPRMPWQKVLLALWKYLMKSNLLDQGFFQSFRSWQFFTILTWNIFKLLNQWRPYLLSFLSRSDAYCQNSLWVVSGVSKMCHTQYLGSLLLPEKVPQSAVSGLKCLQFL